MQKPMWRPREKRPYWSAKSCAQIATQARCPFAARVKKHTGRLLSSKLVILPIPKGKEPSVAKRYAVAKYVLGLLRNKNASQKSAEGTVRGWRKLAHYRANVALQRSPARRVKT
jgi:hypothetical protein